MRDSRLSHDQSRFFSRRQFLRGLGGSLMFLPPLMSLWPKKLEAQAVGRAKRVILMPALYGLDARDFFPATPPLNMQTRVANPDIDLYYTPLSQFPNTNLSVALGSAFNNPRLRSKMNLYHGLDHTRAGGHSYGTPLAAVGESDGEHGHRQPRYGESVDNIISSSPNFYSRTPHVPVLRLSTNDASRYWSFHFRTGTIQYQTTYLGDRAVFDRVFSGLPTSTPGGTTNPDDQLMVDKMKADLDALKRLQRMSSSDKQLLDHYLTGVHELERKINANQVACTRPTLPLQVNQVTDYWNFPLGSGVASCRTMLENYNSTIRSAFLCDLTRVVVYGNTLWRDEPLGGHTMNNMFHSHNDGSGGPLRTAEKHAWFLNLVAQLAIMLDDTPDPHSSSGSLLDNTIMLFTNEHSGVVSHAWMSIAIMTIGSAGGYFRTGNYIDCRQRPYSSTRIHEDCGRPSKQLLISIMQGMGLQPSEYLPKGDGNGFGGFKTDTMYGTLYTPFVNTHNNPLPFIRNA